MKPVLKRAVVTVAAFAGAAGLVAGVTAVTDRRTDRSVAEFSELYEQATATTVATTTVVSSVPGRPQACTGPVVDQNGQTLRCVNGQLTATATTTAPAAYTITGKDCADDGAGLVACAAVITNRHPKTVRFRVRLSVRNTDGFIYGFHSFETGWLRTGDTERLTWLFTYGPSVTPMPGGTGLLVAVKTQPCTEEWCM